MDSVPPGSTDEGDYPLASPGRVRVIGIELMHRLVAVVSRMNPTGDVLHSSARAASCQRRKARVV